MPSFVLLFQEDAERFPGGPFRLRGIYACTLPAVLPVPACVCGRVYGNGVSAACVLRLIPDPRGGDGPKERKNGMAPGSCGLQRYYSESCDQLCDGGDFYSVGMSCDDPESPSAQAAVGACQSRGGHCPAELLVSGPVPGLYAAGLQHTGSRNPGPLPCKWNLFEPASHDFPGGDRKLPKRCRWSWDIS